MALKPFAFKSSKLSVTADQLWSASKSGFKADEKSIKLDLGKTLAKDKIEKNTTNQDTSKSTGFIFGSKLSERVIVNNKSEAGDCSSNISKESSAPDSKVRDDTPKSVSAVFEEIKQRGASSSFVANNKMKESTVDTEWISASSSSLTKDSNESLQLGKDAPIFPREDEVEIVTGEEDETNIYHVSVGRVMGNQRVVLNSQIFPDMIVEKIPTKRVKFSATAPDSEVPVLFLATASEHVAAQLYSTLLRIVENKKDATRKRKIPGTNSEVESEQVVPKKVVSAD